MFQSNPPAVPKMSRPRWGVASRAVAAIFGGYGVTSLATALLARILPMAPHEASTTATITAFVIMPVIVMTVFAVKSAVRAWLWLLGAAAILGAGLWLTFLSGGRI